jgi:hypothetical protein
LTDWDACPADGGADAVGLAFLSRWVITFKVRDAREPPLCAAAAAFPKMNCLRRNGPICAASAVP